MRRGKSRSTSARAILGCRRPLRLQEDGPSQDFKVKTARQTSEGLTLSLGGVRLVHAERINFGCAALHGLRYADARSESLPCLLAEVRVWQAGR
jgi:hypothetical protein